MTGKADGSGANGDTIFAVVDAPTIGEDVDIGAFGAKLAVALKKVSMFVLNI